jgi:hypothetical protein
MGQEKHKPHGCRNRAAVTFLRLASFSSPLVPAYTFFAIESVRKFIESWSDIEMRSLFLSA